MIKKSIEQGPTVQHRELYSMSYNKPNGKEYEKEYEYMDNSITFPNTRN